MLLGTQRQRTTQPPDGTVPLSTKLFALCCACLFLLLAQARPGNSHRENTIYVIRHGEKPADGSHGLTRKGQLRAQCLKRLFGPHSKYHIDYIMAPHFIGEQRRRAYDTVLPLSKELGIEINHGCNRKDANCVADTISDTISAKEFHGDVLISWRHNNIDAIVKLLDVDDNIVPRWPKHRFDLIWTIHQNGTFTINEQDCPHLDYLDDDGNVIGDPPLLVQNDGVQFLH